MRLVTAYDVDQNSLVNALAEELRRNDKVQRPDWAAFVKTGSHAERMPDDPDWWYQRAGSLLRRIYMRPTGVLRLRTVYGGRKNRGFKPEIRRDASGKIIRVIFQQLGDAGLVKKGKKGREITPAGMKLVDSAALKVSKAGKEKNDVDRRPEKKEAGGAGGSPAAGSQAGSPGKAARGGPGKGNAPGAGPEGKGEAGQHKNSKA